MVSTDAAGDLHREMEGRIGSSSSSSISSSRSSSSSSINLTDDLHSTVEGCRSIIGTSTSISSCSSSSSISSSSSSISSSSSGSSDVTDDLYRAVEGRCSSSISSSISSSSSSSSSQLPAATSLHHARAARAHTRTHARVTHLRGPAQQHGAMASAHPRRANSSSAPPAPLRLSEWRKPAYV